MSKCANGTYLKWWVGIDIRELLLADENLSELTGGDVYPLVAPEGTEGMFIVYRRVKYEREYSKMGLMDDIARVEIIAVAEHYEESVALAALIDNVLTGTHKSDEGYSLTFELHDSEETFDDNKYMQTLIFEVK